MNSCLFCLYFIFGLLGFFVMFGGVHKIHEGHIGVYMRGGALLNTYTEPGIHFMVPIVTSYHSVQVTIQTDQVTNIPCGTSGGVLIYFDKIEVVNQLKKEYAFETIKQYTIDYDKTWIFDKIHHEINQFCSSHSLQEVYIDQFDQLDESLKDALLNGTSKYAPGIDIISVRVTKPRVPSHIGENYEKREREKTQLLISIESNKVKEKEAETDKMIEKIKAETKTAVADIQREENLLMKAGKQKIQQIENEIGFEKQKTLAEAENYRRLKEIDINQKKLTKEFLIYNAAISVKDANKVYFGKSIPDYFNTNSELIGDPKIDKTIQDVKVEEKKKKTTAN